MEQKPKKKFYKRWWFWIIVVIVIVVIGANLGSGSNNSKSTNSGNSSSGSSSKPADSKKYSMDKFMKITMGMSYTQVKGILGDGKEDSSSGDGAEKTVSYTWQNDDGSNISVMLQGDKVTNKAQAMLQNMDAKVTMEKYNKVNNGMTYDQVKAILGEGQLSSQTDLLGSKSEIYEWINSDGANMNVTFEDGKVESKAQAELK